MYASYLYLITSLKQLSVTVFYDSFYPEVGPVADRAFRAPGLSSRDCLQINIAPIYKTILEYK